MPLSREQREIIENQYLVDLFDKMEADVISDLARRVQKTGRLTETAEIYARNLREMGYSPDRILQQVMKELNADAARQMEIAEETNAYKRDVAEIINQTTADALEAGDMLTAMAGDMDWNEDMRLWKTHGVDLTKDNALSQIINAVQAQTRGAVRNITGTTMNLAVGGIPVPNLYQNALDLCTIKVCAGISYQQAINETVKRYAQAGLTVKSPSGRNYHIDTAARMAVRTGVGQLCGQITQHNIQKTGSDLVYVDAHAGARPEHAVWQGKVYVYNSTNASKYPQYGDFFNETDYGSVTGLLGANCMHNFYAYWPGDPIPEFKEPDPVNINGKEMTYYECTQEQRKEERAIRQTKRELDAAKALGDTEAVKQLQQKLSGQMAKYTSFSTAANLRPKYERMGNLNASSPNYVTATKSRAIADTYRQEVKMTKEERREFVKEMAKQKSCVYDNSPEPNRNLNLAYTKKHSREGFYDIVLHGDKDWSYVYDVQTSPETLAKIILGRDDYKAGTPVQLLSCETGKEDDDGYCFAQHLATLLNTTVSAPRGLLSLKSDGTMKVNIDTGNEIEIIEVTDSNYFGITFKQFEPRYK